MGIFSKFQIKDIKSKILGGKVKHKVDVPAISVIPPTPSAKNIFTFPENNNGKARVLPTHDERKLELRKITRQRSHSLPDCVDKDPEPSQVNFGGQPADNVDAKIYLKPPRNGRRRRKHHKRTRSCPGGLSDIQNTGVSGMKTVASCSNFCPDENGPSLSEACESSSVTKNASHRKTKEDNAESQEFRKEEDQVGDIFCGNSSTEYLSDESSCLNNQESFCDLSMASSISSFSSNNGANITIKNSPSSEFSEPGETTPLCAEITTKSEKSEESPKATLGERIRRRVVSSYRTTPETRWSLDLERLQAGGNQNFLEIEEDNDKWDGRSEKMPSVGVSKDIASTWSLDLDNKTKINRDFERAKSEICVGGTPFLKQKSDPNNCEHVITNAKSLDLDLDSKSDGVDSERANSETMLRSTSLKRGINDYIGRFNGIVSKFSTWSLDIELNRKRSLDGELNDSNRAQSETLLDEVEADPPKAERSLSYHALLYDIDEASRYQIYQPTVYEIGDESGANDGADAIPGRAQPGAKAGQYSNSMKFISKQFGNLYENSKNLYKHRYAIIDAIKQKEKELKAIADRQNAEKPTEQIFKPKSTSRQRSQSYHKHGHKHSKVDGMQ